MNLSSTFPRISLLTCLAAAALLTMIGCAREVAQTSHQPTRDDARNWVTQTQRKDSFVELDTAISFGGAQTPLLIVSVPLDQRVHPYTPYGPDWETKILYFNAIPPSEIVGHQLLRSAGDTSDVWEEISCQSVVMARLSDSVASPVVLAQRCAEDGLLTWRFVIFDSTSINTPGVGTATWSFGTDQTHVHEMLVPILDSAIATEPSSHLGDGKTVVEGVEGEIDSTGTSLRNRTYYLIWRNGQLVRELGDWTSTGE